LLQYFVRLPKNETTRNLFILRKLFEEPNLSQFVMKCLRVSGTEKAQMPKLEVKKF